MLKNQHVLGFDEASARKNALVETAQHPLTLIPPIATGVFAFGLTIFSIVSTPVALTLVVGGILAGATNWFKQFKSGAYIQKYYDQCRKDFKRMKEEKTSKLSAELEKFNCERGVTQLQQFEEKNESLEEIFGRVLSRTELTFERFMGAVERLYQLALDNLENIIVLHMNIEDTNSTDINRRIKTLSKKDSLTEPEQKTLTALQKQLGVLEETEREIENLLAQNEEALTAMDQTGQIVLRVRNKSRDQSPEQAMALAMDMLMEMIKRAQKDPRIEIQQTETTA